MSHSRRDFLKRTGCALGATALLSGIEQFSLVNAFAQDLPASDYRALICVFLSGGNDGNNMVIPIDGYETGYGSLGVGRAAAGLAIPKSALLPIAPANTSGVTYGFHPSMTEMQQLFTGGKLAVQCNVGTLVQPLTRALYQSNPNARPYQLFSHSDQVTQQMTSVSNSPGQTGWGGRAADQLLGINGSAPLPMIISTAGTSLFTTGKNTRPLAVSPAPTSLTQLLVLNGYAPPPSTDARSIAFDQIRTVDLGSNLVKSSGDVMAQALQASAALSTDPALTTAFPATTLGNQLKQVAKLIKANLTQAALGLRRQIFFVSLGGFDTHSNQTSATFLGGQGSLLLQLSQAMKAFYDATLELGVSQQVTTFTLSDFGRTLQPAGSGANVGSDHGWGSHQFIMGDAVQGGKFYGTFPTLTLASPDDTDTRGRWIPSTSIDQYAATLSSWYGLASSDIQTVFPFVSRFPTANLGFLG